MDESEFRTISAREFARRFRSGVVLEEITFLWFFGAGCSASSGVPTAAECVRRWLKSLKYFETGEDANVDAWAARRFLNYDPEDPAGVYAEVIEALFHTESDLRRELARLTHAAEPGFGYATLAQLMTHQSWGHRTSFAFTTNFDDLFAESLHLYSQVRPLILSQESVGRFTPMPSESPTLIKLHGDAHAMSMGEGANQSQFPEMVKERLREKIADSGLIMLGYGGRDAAMLDLLQGMPSNAPLNGLFWINETPPRGAFGAELRKRGAVWVRHGDFDELMYFIRLEFGLGHPTVNRFERIFRQYDAKFRELSSRNGMAIERTGPKDGIEDRSEPSRLMTPISARRATDETRRERLRQSLNAYSRLIAGAANEEALPREEMSSKKDDGPAFDVLLDAAGLELHGGGHAPGAEQPDAEEARTAAATAPDSIRIRTMGDDPDAPARSDRFSRSGDDDIEDVEALAEEASQDDASPDQAGGIDSVVAQLKDASELEIPPSDSDSSQGRAAKPLSRAANDALKRREQGLSGEGARDGLDASRRMMATRSRKTPIGLGAPVAADGLPAPACRRLPADQAAAGDMSFAMALEESPNDAMLRVRRARYLATAAGDLRRAEEEFETAQQQAPDNVTVLREYARFSLEHLRDGPRAERLLAKALNCELRNGETLRALARYLLRAAGNLDEAETCLRLSIEVAPQDAQGYVDYAAFLETRRGDRAGAEAQLRRAANLTPPSAAAMSELALHYARRVDSIDEAEQALNEAYRLAPDEPGVALARAMVAARKDQLEEAEAQFRHAIELQPESFRARKAYSDFLIERSGDLDAAEAQLREAIATNAVDGEPLSAFARFLDAHRGDAAGAERYHRRAVESEPYNPEVLVSFAEYLAKRQDMIEEADALFQDALSLSQRSTRTLRAYGRFLATVKKDPDSAERQFREAVSIDPEEPETLDDLAQFLHSVRRDAEEAEVYFREALRVAPDRAETLNRFASFLRSTRRDLDEAERFYRRALEAKPKDAFALARATQFLLAKGERQEGLAMLTESFDAAWRMSAQNRPGALMLELWIYRYAHDSKRAMEALKAAIALIDSGVRCDGWEMAPVVESAIRIGHDDPETLRSLVAVSCDGADPSLLDKARRS